MARHTIRAMEMRMAWDEHAGDWIAWARSRDHDHFFWRFSLPRLLELLPPPGALTLDLGCGEGRLSRELAARGHRVLGVEQSGTLVSAARAAAPEIDVREGDAAAIPLEDGGADLVVASMVLMNLDDLEGALAEVARVLAPGGRFCASLVHPFNSPKRAPYFSEHAYAEVRERAGLRMTFTDRHRPLEDYSRALEGAGLVIEALREPVPDDAHVAAHPEVAVWRERPAFLLLRTRAAP
jgi:SAM-dependent methyltransferase